jgi:hypothetical protein
MKMQNRFFLVVLIALLKFTLSWCQPVYMGSQISNGIMTGGCISGCVTPGVPGSPGFICNPGGSGNHATQTINQTITVPGGQYVTITANTQECDPSTDGLDSGDFFIVNGVTIVTGVTNTRINYTGCFYNQCSTNQDIVVTLVVNRRDETIELDWVFSQTDPGGCTPIGTPITPAFTQVGPICEGENFTLPTTSTNGVTGTWSPSENNMTTTTYTFTPTSGPCATTATMEVVVNPPQSATFTLNDFCAPTSGSATITGVPGGTFSFAPPGGGGASINPSTGVITGAMAGTTYNVQYTSPGPCPGQQIVAVTATPGPTGTLSGSATLCPGQCATFSFSFTSGSEPYTINLTASPPGLPLPPIPGVSASQVFTICYGGPGVFPTIDLSTFTITIPSVFNGSGSLILTGISDGSGCPGTASGSFNLTLSPAPTAQPAGPLTACADANGNGTFNLTSLNNTVNGGNGSLTVSWFEDMAATIPISNPGAYVSSGGTVYANVSNGPCESATVAVQLNVEMGNVPFISMLCAESGMQDCSICLIGNTIDLDFLFGNGNNYTVTVRNNNTNVNHTGLVNNTTPLSVPISSSTTFELISIQPVSGCPNFATYGDQVNVTIVPAPEIDPVTIAPACGDVVLPPITGSNLSGNEKYFTGPNGTGTIYNPGDMIFASQLLYIYDTNAGCDDQETVQVTILPAVSFDEVADITACSSATLPAITGTGISTAVTYNTNPNGTGTSYPAGSVLNQSITLYIFDPNADPACVAGVVDIVITIQGQPAAPVILPVSCAGGNGNASVTVNSPLGANFQYNIDGGTFQTGTTFSGLGNGSHTIVVQDINTLCQNTLTFNVACDCSTPAVITLPSTSGNICIGQPFVLNGISFSGAATQVSVTNNGAGTLSGSNFTSSPFNITYNPAASDAGKVINITFTSNDPDGTGPCPPEVVIFQLNVRALPTGTIQGPTQTCINSSITLTASGGVSYIWSDNGGANPIATFNNLTTSRTFTVTITDSNGCKNTVMQNVEIRSLSAGRDTTASFCKVTPQTINLFTYLTPGTVNTGIWKIGNDTIKTANNYTITDLPVGTQTILYILSDPVCGRDTARMVVSLRLSNNAGMNVTRNECQGSAISLNLPALIGTHDSGGTWSVLPLNSVNLLNPADIKINTLGPGLYSFRYTIPNNGCPGAFSQVDIFITPKPNAGQDVNFSSCIGSQIDLLTLVTSTDKTGIIRNPQLYGGLTGSVWNTAGFTVGNFTFEYILPATANCPGDTSKITINLQSSLNAGTDRQSSFCEGATLTLSQFLSSQANPGGTFYLNNQVVPNGIFNPPANQNTFNFLYIVGDGVLCPRDTAFITLSKTVKPVSTFAAMDDICVGKCRNLTLNTNAGAGATVYLTATSPQGAANIRQQFVTTNTGTINVNICGSAVAPFNFNNWPVNSNVTVRLDSIKLSGNNGCVFTYNTNENFTILPLPVKTLNPIICKEDVFILGNQTFTFSNPSGTVTLTSTNPNACDTTANVALRFYDVPKGSLTISECDQSKTYPIGDRIFTFANPRGDAVLKGRSQNGCDSIVAVEIKYEKQVIQGSFTVSTCKDTYAYLGKVFDKNNSTDAILLPGRAVGGCDSLVNVNIIFTPFTFTNSVNYACEETSATLTLNLASHPGPYNITLDGAVIQNAATLPFSTTVNAGDHSVIITNPEGCTDTVSFIVDAVSAGPDVQLTQSQTGSGGVQILTVAPPNSIFDLVWTPSNTLSCDDCFNPVANPGTTTTYTLSYLYGNRCSASKQITVEVINTDIVLPNIFNPNSGANGSFFVQFPEKVTGIIRQMSIYDRWGNLVFDAKNVPPNDPAVGWKGSFGNSGDVVPGVYVYWIEVFVDNDGSTRQFKGDITVIK